MSEFVILDVGHGSCCYYIENNTNTILFDCGHKTGTDNRPSLVLGDKGHVTVELLVVSNYDEDHISDLSYLTTKLDVRSLLRNKTISKEQLRKLKLAQSGKISTAMESMLEMIGDYTGGELSPQPDFPNVTRWHYNNNYPFGDGNDTNNISLVSVVKIYGTTFLIPGDIEKDGWEMLIKNQPELKTKLKDIDYFIASHHGRINGYYEPMFSEYGCRPLAFIFSDSPKQYDTQETDGLYRKWATGMTFNGETRKILTTRKDGSITWTFD